MGSLKLRQRAHFVEVATCSLVIGLMTWRSTSPSFAQVSGFVDDFRLNAANSTSPFPVFDVAADSFGDFYLFWRDNQATGRAYLQKRTPDGTLVWESVQQAQGFDYYESYISLTVAPDNNRVLVSYSAATKPALLRAGAAPTTYQGHVVMFDSLGNRILGPLWVDSILGPPSIYSQDLRSCLFRGDGGFSVLEREPSASATALYLINFDSTGHRESGPLRINDCPPPLTLCSVPQYVHGAELPNGGFVATWDGLFWWGTTPQNAMGTPFYRIFDRTGAPVSPMLMTTLDSATDIPCYVNDSLPFCEGNNGDVAVAEDGSFLIAWQANIAVPTAWLGNKIACRRFAPDGTPLTPMVLVSDAMSNEVSIEPNACYGDGYFYVIWTDARNSSWAGFRDVFSQKIDMAGHPVAPNYRLNDVPFSPRHRPYWHGIASLGGRILTVWDDQRDMPDSGHGLYAQITPDSLLGVYWPGDIVVNYSIDAGDIIAEVNYIFKSGQPAMGGAKYSDVSGDCTATAADIIWLVNHVFKSGPAPLPPCE